MRPPEEKAPTFADQGIDKRDAHRWQKLAEVPAPTFEAHIGEVRRRAEKLTVSGAIRACATSKRPARPSAPVRMVRDRTAEPDYAEPEWTDEAEYASEGAGSPRGHALAAQIDAFLARAYAEHPPGESGAQVLGVLDKHIQRWQAREARLR